MLGGLGGIVNFLTALLAFAVTMLILSTTVTAFVQVLHRVRNVRERHLRHFLAVYFDEVIWTRFRERIDNDAAENLSATGQFVSRPGWKLRYSPASIC